MHTAVYNAVLFKMLCVFCFKYHLLLENKPNHSLLQFDLSFLLFYLIFFVHLVKNRTLFSCSRMHPGHLPQAPAHQSA